MSCATPIESTRLVDYWAGALAEPELHALEDHVFACEHCARRNAAIGELVRGTREVVGRRGGIQLCATRALIDRLAAAGLVVRHYHASPGDHVPCSVAATDDLLVTWLAVEVAAYARLDVVVDTGVHVFRFEDVPFDRDTGVVAFTLGGDLARTFPTMTIVDTVLAIDDRGTRTIGEYTFHHTAYRPG